MRGCVRVEESILLLGVPLVVAKENEILGIWDHDNLVITNSMVWIYG